MCRNRSLERFHVVLLCVLDSQVFASTVVASVSPARVLTQALSSVSVVLTATAAFLPGLIMIDNQAIDPGLSSSLLISDSGTPTTSSTSSSASTNSNVIGQLPLAGPMIAGVLVGIIVIAAIVVICFLQRRPQHPRRRRHSLEAQFILQPDSRPHRHSKSRLLRNENPENATPKRKYRRFSRRSRNSTRIVKLEVLNSVPPGASRSEARESSLPSVNRQWPSGTGSSPTNSTFSLTPNTNKIGVNKPHPQVVDSSQTSITLVPSTISSDQVEQYSPSPTTKLPPQPLPPPPKFIKTSNLINPCLDNPPPNEH